MGALNISLLIANASLSDALAKAAAQTLDGSIIAMDQIQIDLEAETQQIATERARLTQKIDRLSSLLAGGFSREAISEAAAPTGGELEATWSEMQGGTLRKKPDPLAIDRLSDEDRQRIVDYRKTMPRKLSEGALIQGDIDSLLADPTWNPDGRQLDGDSRQQLAGLMTEYRYFARLSVMERSQAARLDLPGLRESGAFVEYEGRAPKPQAPVAMSHAEPSDRPGYRRMYFFYADDYPDLYHQAQVEKEQALRVFVDAHRLIADGELPREER